VPHPAAPASSTVSAILRRAKVTSFKHDARKVRDQAYYAPRRSRRHTVAEFMIAKSHTATGWIRAKQLGLPPLTEESLGP
jgi:hypothetical protein